MLHLDHLDATVRRRLLPHASLVRRWALVGVCMAATSCALAQTLPMKIRLTLDGAVVTATLDNTPTARDFAALLPLSLTLKNYADVERIADLPRRLSIDGAPQGTTPQPGDIAYYAPWGNVAFFVAGDVYASGLVRLGRVDSGLPALQRNGTLKVRIERAGD
jgi:hypothetical protein